MLTKTQENAIFTNIETDYTVSGNAYTALKTWRNHWSGELDTPVIMLQFKPRSRELMGSIGRAAEWDIDVLSVDVFAQTDVTNAVHGGDIAGEIMRELELWFKESATEVLYGEGMSVGNTSVVQDLSDLEIGVYRLNFEANILYKLI